MPREAAREQAERDGDGDRVVDMLRGSMRVFALALAFYAPLVACREPLEGEPLELLCEDEFSYGVDVDTGVSVDILFVIDNSASMLPHQIALAAGVEQLLARLDAAEADYRIAFTTTDAGNPWCDPELTTPEAGSLVLSSCKDRIADFGDDPSAFELGCTQPCTLDSAALAITPTRVAGSDELRARPWLERAAGLVNLPTTTDPLAALRCFMPQGVSGCGFESPLESMYLALARADDADEPEYGFLRERASLAIVILTDEVDCSHNPAHAEIFDAAGNKAFWQDPSAAQPTSALCWNAGVECVGDPAGYDNCDAVDLDVDGQPTDFTRAVLYPVSRYRDRLQGIANAKLELDPDAQLLLTILAGVEGGGETWTVEYADALDPAVQAEFGIAPGCTASSGATALPPVRMRELAEQVDPLGLWSVCADDHGGALANLGERLVANEQPSCYFGCVADRDRSTPRFEPACAVTMREPVESVPVPECERSEDGSYRVESSRFVVPEGANFCYVTRTDPDGTQTLDPSDAMSPACVEQGTNVELELVARPGFSLDEGWALASCMLDGCRDFEC